MSIEEKSWLSYKLSFQIRFPSKTESEREGRGCAALEEGRMAVLWIFSSREMEWDVVFLGIGSWGKRRGEIKKKKNGMVDMDDDIVYQDNTSYTPSIINFFITPCMLLEMLFDFFTIQYHSTKCSLPNFDQLLL